MPLDSVKMSVLLSLSHYCCRWFLCKYRRHKNGMFCDIYRRNRYVYQFESTNHKAGISMCAASWVFFWLNYLRESCHAWEYPFEYMDHTGLRMACSQYITRTRYQYNKGFLSVGGTIWCQCQQRWRELQQHLIICSRISTPTEFVTTLWRVVGNALWLLPPNTMTHPIKQGKPAIQTWELLTLNWRILYSVTHSTARTQAKVDQNSVFYTLIQLTLPYHSTLITHGRRCKFVLSLTMAKNPCVFFSILTV